jgi:hypothetical protein
MSSDRGLRVLPRRSRSKEKIGANHYRDGNPHRGKQYHEIDVRQSLDEANKQKQFEYESSHLNCLIGTSSADV